MTHHNMNIFVDNQYFASIQGHICQDKQQFITNSLYIDSYNIYTNNMTTAISYHQTNWIQKRQNTTKRSLYKQHD